MPRLTKARRATYRRAKDAVEKHAEVLRTCFDRIEKSAEATQEAIDAIGDDGEELALEAPGVGDSELAGLMAEESPEDWRKDALVEIEDREAYEEDPDGEEEG